VEKHENLGQSGTAIHVRRHQEEEEEVNQRSEEVSHHREELGNRWLVELLDNADHHFAKEVFDKDGGERREVGVSGVRWGERREMGVSGVRWG